jgi:ribonuclease-3
MTTTASSIDLGIAFDDPWLLACALTHRSYLNENPALPYPDNERLEFLGDAVVDLIAAAFLFERFPDLREGDLTSLRAALVKGETLARFAVELGLPSHLRLSRGEEQNGARARVPILASAFEAVVGALFLDQGLRAASEFVLRFLAPEAERVHAQRLDRDAKSVLQELAQGQWHLTPEYRLVHSYGPEHAKMFVVAVFVGATEWGRGVGSSRHRAEIAAAKNALAKRARVEPPMSSNRFQGIGGEAPRRKNERLDYRPT